MRKKSKKSEVYTLILKDNVPDSSICPECKEKAEWKHLHNCAYGIEGTHMDGSERYECSKCGHTLYAIEGKAHGLQFFCD